MAIQVSGTQVISDARALTNVTSIDATTAASIIAGGVGGGTFGTGFEGVSSLNIGPVFWTGTTFVATVSNNVFYSTDGSTWTQNTNGFYSNNDSTVGFMWGLGAGGSVLGSMAAVDASTRRVMYTSNGATITRPSGSFGGSGGPQQLLYCHGTDSNGNVINGGASTAGRFFVGCGWTGAGGSQAGYWSNNLGASWSQMGGSNSDNFYAGSIPSSRQGKAYFYGRMFGTGSSNYGGSSPAWTNGNDPFAATSSGTVYVHDTGGGTNPYFGQTGAGNYRQFNTSITPGLINNASGPTGRYVAYSTTANAYIGAYNSAVYISATGAAPWSASFAAWGSATVNGIACGGGKTVVSTSAGVFMSDVA